jgi:translation initiation factor IF-1
MVKNVSGGNKSKGFARKNSVKGSGALRVSEDEAEIYAQVTRVLGGAMCHVVDLNGRELLCHIRGKFRGRGKRDNFISIGTWMLVGLREWEKEPSKDKRLNCDVIEVYNDTDKNRLKSTVNSINWDLFITNDNRSGGNALTEDYDDIVFTDESTQEYQKIIQSQVNENQLGKNSIITTEDDDEFVNVDDI